MKTNIKTNLIIAVFLAVVAGLAGCRDDEEKKEEEVVPTDLPEWLLLKIAEYEEYYQDSYIKIYEGKWENQTVYFISSIYFSCPLCEVYRADGEKIITVEDTNKFMELSKGWKLVWKSANADRYDF
ncbi:MAG: hypothetical protein LBJ47_03895 [Tannerella sp.]|jgi:hypothetical protein|nr:hypothetical protein [Tannerella sp.]